MTTETNKVRLVGTVDATPALGETTRGVKTLNLWVKTVDERKRVSSHKVVAWGKLARERAWEIGDRVVVHGSLQYRIHRLTGGQPVSIAEVTAHTLRSFE